MTKRSMVLFGLITMIGGVLFVTGCNLDSSTSREVDAAIDRARAEQEQRAEQQAAAPSNPQPSPAAQGSQPAPASQPAQATGSAPTGSGSLAGFVWKPISEGDGRLVVLLPSSYVGRVSGVTVRRGGTVLESGRFSGNTNGNRPTYRFSRPGAGYGSGLTVVATLRTGGSVTWNIPNGGSRVG